jgi:hypothetical protein
VSSWIEWKRCWIPERFKQPNVTLPRLSYSYNDKFDVFVCRQESDRLKSIRSWPRRPLDTIDTLKQLGIGRIQNLIGPINALAPQHVINQ